MQIEKGIPIYRKGQEPKVTKYPWPAMDEGDSVFFEGETTVGNAASSARQWGKKNDKKFVVRTLDGGVRIWRTE